MIHRDFPSPTATRDAVAEAARYVARHVIRRGASLRDGVVFVDHRPADRTRMSGREELIDIATYGDGPRAVRWVSPHEACTLFAREYGDAEAVAMWQDLPLPDGEVRVLAFLSEDDFEFATFKV